MWFYYHCLHISFHLVLVNCFTSDLGEVVFVNILFRHGDRTPIDPYPNDPYKNNSLWPVGWGQLTDVGKRGHYELGKWLRKRYGNFLPDHYNRNDIYIVSTDVDRTLMSAYSNLAGLYEPDPKTNWNLDIKWTPIPVHTIPENMDKMVAGKVPCPKYDSELKILKTSPEFQKIDKENKPLYDYLTKYTGRNITNVVDVEMIHDTLFIEQLYKFKLPNWTKEVYPQPMKKISDFTFSIPCYTPTLARLKIGLLIGDMFNHMQEKISGTMKINRKAWMYSAHDTTVANVLNGLGLFEPHCPPYHSLILIELRKKDKDYYVVIHYKNSTLAPAYLMKLKDCDKLCPFEKFKSIVTPLIPQNWEEECQDVRFVENIYDTAAAISLVTIVSLALILLLSLGIVLKFFKNKRSNQVEFAYKNAQYSRDGILQRLPSQHNGYDTCTPNVLIRPLF